MAGTVERILALKLIADTTSVSKDMKKAEKSTKRIGASFKKMGAIIGGAFAAFAVVDFLKQGIQDAADMEAAMKKLGRTTRNMGKDWGEVDNRINDVLAEAERLNFDDIAAAGTLNNLITQLGSVAKATKVMTVGFDVAAALFDGDLNKATTTIQKALNGSATALRKLGLPENTKPFQVLPRLMRKFKNQANEQLQTLQGKIDTFVTWLGNQGEAIGAELAKWIDPIVNFVTKDLLPKFEEIKTALTPLLASMVTFVNTALAPLITWLKQDGNAAAVALTAIAVALGLLLIPLFALTLKVIVIMALFAAMAAAILAVKLAVDEVTKFFAAQQDDVRKNAQGYADAMSSPIIVEATRMKEAVVGDLVSMTDALDAMQAKLRAVKNSGVFKHIVGRLLRIPGFGDGGIVTEPTLAMVGEKGPEAIVPLTGPNAGFGGMTINITTGVGDPVEIGRQVDRVLRAYRGRAGLAA